MVIFRADDAGSSEGANLAILETVRNGVVRNVSVMAPGLAFDHAVPLLQSFGPEVCLGLHVTLNAEWEHVKWGPVASDVPGLCDGEFFTTAPNVLNERGFSLDEAMREVRAQLAKLRSAGLRVEYLDEHMGVGWLPGLGSALRELCREESLVYCGDFSYLKAGTADVEALVAAIEEVPDGEVRVVVGHPGSDIDPVMERFTLPGVPEGRILAERAQDRRTLTDARLRAVGSATYLEVRGS